MAAASPISLMLPWPRAQLSTVAMPNGPPAWLSSHGASSPVPSTDPSSSTRAAGAGAGSSAAPGSTASSRSRSEALRISSTSSTPSMAVRSYATRARSAGALGSSTSLTISVRTRLSLTASRWSRKFCPALPLTSSARSTSSANDPNWVIHLAAVFSPTPGMPGRLSDGSPRSAAKSGYCCGVRPYFSSTFSGVNRVSSETPLVGYSTVVCSDTSWKESRSPVTISTSKPHGLRLRRQRRDHVVGLEAVDGEPRHVHRVEQLADQLHLPLELVGGLGAVRLVLGELGRPPRLAGHVERHREVRGRLVAQRVRQHRREAVDGVGRLARRGREVLRGQREERPVRQGVPVHEHQAGAVRCGRLVGLLRC